jgi:protein-S-isoprenylcysteine O-methyltransferase Ste14
MTLAAEVHRATNLLWAVLMAVWITGMFMARKTVRRQSRASRFWQSAIVLFGSWLLFGNGTGYPWLDGMAVPSSDAVEWAGLALTCAGIGFAIWARMTLGANWSGVVTVKQGHTLVRRGPYRLVRHPIYTGIMLGFAGSALTRGSVHSLVALPVCAFGFWLKSLTEEQFMIEQFGNEYLQYRCEVPALVPFVF